MILINDLFVNPENLGDVKEMMKTMEYRIKMVEALEHAKRRLSETTTLDSNTLSKCSTFISYVNKSDAVSNFNLEVSKLNLNELAFTLISFEERRLKTLLELFKATDVKKYVQKQNINCLHRREIFTRIRSHLTKCKGSRFDHLYGAIAYAKNPIDSQVATFEDPEPKTAAEESDAFTLLGVRRENFKNVFTEHIANDARLMTVESRYPRAKSGGDAFVSFDFESARGPVAMLSEGDNPIAIIHEVFGHNIASVIDRSDLRKWEKRNGYVDTTNCVKVKTICRIDLRICYDATIANILHSESDHEVLPPVNCS
ncbi:hypothetical protein LTR67_006376 [Exophiala xenobiotica]